MFKIHAAQVRNIKSVTPAGVRVTGRLVDFSIAREPISFRSPAHCETECRFLGKRSKGRLGRFPIDDALALRQFFERFLTQFFLSHLLWD